VDAVKEGGPTHLSWEDDPFSIRTVPAFIRLCLATTLPAWGL